MRAVGYARVSGEEQKQQKTVKPQIQIIENHCKEKGYEFVKGYIDEGRTGTTTKGRKIDLIIEDASKDKFDILLFDKWDRLFRDKGDHGDFKKKLLSYGKKWWAINDTNEELSADIVNVLGEHESKRIGYNTRRGLRGRAEEGIFPSHLKGYLKLRSNKTRKLRIKVDDLWGARIKNAIKLYNEDVPWKDIHEKTKLVWNTFVSIIHRPEYTSFIVYEGKKFPIAYEPLFTEKARLKALIRYWKQRNRANGMPNSEFYQLKKQKAEEITKELKRLDSSE